MVEMEKKLGFSVNVRLEQALEEELPEVMAYAFDETGQFLAATPLPKGKLQGQVKLELPSELAGTTVRVVLGPPPIEEREEMPLWMASRIYRGKMRKEAPSLASLLRKGGYEKRFRIPEHGIGDLVVFPDDWKKWLRCRCVIRGRLVKRVPLPDGTTEELGVYQACVKIYEVDKIRRIILQLPERDLFRLRDDLRVILENQLPRPVDSPTPLPLGGELDPIFSATSALQLRNALLATEKILHRFICALRWLWYKFHTDLIKGVCTDEQGRFETTIWYPCAGDKPDLYFKAVQDIGGAPHTLYDPGVACYTHWNYACGSEVVLETDDPAAITSVPPPPVEVPPGVSLWVMPIGVGNIRLDQIKPSGLTDFFGWIDVPFGGTLGFTLGHSSEIPYEALDKPAYYRWLYNKLDDAGNETEWREFAAPVAETVVRHYIDYDPDLLELSPTYPVYPLGPKTPDKMSITVYEFKPHQPPESLEGHKREWPVDNWFGDIYSGILQSVNLPGGVASAAGKYKIKLEIYDKGGNRLKPVKQGEGGTFYFIVPSGEAEDGTIQTRMAKSDEIEDDGFVFYLHVDNNKCEAEIYEASVIGADAGDVSGNTCGFISGYVMGSNVLLSFKAKHPNGFARFEFTVVRGSSGYVKEACAPRPPDPKLPSVARFLLRSALVTDTDVNGFKRNASCEFYKQVNEGHMRGEGCLKAAFGENLYVFATATDGWARLSGLDASALPKAFALDPKTT